MIDFISKFKEKKIDEELINILVNELVELRSRNVIAFSNLVLVIMQIVIVVWCYLFPKVTDFEYIHALYPIITINIPHVIYSKLILKENDFTYEKSKNELVKIYIFNIFAYSILGITTNKLDAIKPVLSIMIFAGVFLIGYDIIVRKTRSKLDEVMTINKVARLIITKAAHNLTELQIELLEMIDMQLRDIDENSEIHEELKIWRGTVYLSSPDDMKEINLEELIASCGFLDNEETENIRKRFKIYIDCMKTIDSLKDVKESIMEG